MNKVFRLLFLCCLTLTISCSKDDDKDQVEPLRDFAEQYAADIESIDEYLDTHYITVDANYNVSMAPIPAGGSQQSIRAQQDYPLEYKMVNQNDVDYKVYYIKVREGVNEQPSRVDSVLVGYRGSLIDSTQFDQATNPRWFPLESVVQGWAEIIPMFKTGYYDTGEGPNPVNFTDYGVGVMFLPSGLGYFAQASGVIPRYSPLIFTFNLYELSYRDHDSDGILSKDEVAVAGDDPLKYDSDGDGIPNMYDNNDDNDNYLTSYEIRGGQLDGPIIFPYPTCSSGTPKHLDPTCH